MPRKSNESSYERKESPKNPLTSVHSPEHINPPKERGRKARTNDARLSQSKYPGKLATGPGFAEHNYSGQ